MALINIEGFERINNLTTSGNTSNIQTLNTTAIISSDDGYAEPYLIAIGGYANCARCVSSLGSSNSGYYLDNWPKIYIPNPDNTIVSEGVIGFAFFPYLPAGGAWSTSSTANCFSPFAAICDTAGKPIIFLGLNSSQEVEVRRWANNPSNYYWNTSPYFVTEGYHSALSGVQQWLTQGTALNATRYTLDHAKFTLLGSTSGGPITNGEWNYIELKYLLSTSATGYIQLKVNRSSSDATLDIDVSSVQTSAIGNINASSLALGLFWGHRSTAAANPSQLGFRTYFDDIYWLSAAASGGSRDMNDFLGYKKIVRAVSFDAETSSDMTNVGAASSVACLDDANFDNTVALTDYVKADNKEQSLVMQAATVALPGDYLACKAKYLVGQSIGTNRVHISATRGVDTEGPIAQSFTTDGLLATIDFHEIGYTNIYADLVPSGYVGDGQYFSINWNNCYVWPTQSEEKPPYHIAGYSTGPYSFIITPSSGYQLELVSFGITRISSTSDRDNYFRWTVSFNGNTPDQSGIAASPAQRYYSSPRYYYNWTTYGTNFGQSVIAGVNETITVNIFDENNDGTFGYGRNIQMSNIYIRQHLSDSIMRVRSACFDNAPDGTAWSKTKMASTDFTLVYDT